MPRGSPTVRRLTSRNPEPRRRLLGALAALPIAALARPPAARAFPDRGIVGAPAPELDVQFWIDADGKPTTFRMQAQRGRWVHLKCWQSWCPGCHAHGFPALQALVAAFRDEPRFVNVAVQTVFEGYATNTAERVRETQLRYRLPIVMGHDPGRRNGHDWPTTMTAYRTAGTPWHVLVEPGGRVVYDGFGLDAERVIAYVRGALARS